MLRQSPASPALLRIIRGRSLPNATVTVTNDATGVKKTVNSNSAGSYTVIDLIPGTYTVKVEDAGFQTSQHSGIGVEVAHASTVDVVLQVGNTTQTVEVNESAITLDTTQPDLNTTIENKVVQELPSSIRRPWPPNRPIYLFSAGCDW